jgi:hypothetical protein
MIKTRGKSAFYFRREIYSQGRWKRKIDALYNYLRCIVRQNIYIKWTEGYQNSLHDARALQPSHAKRIRPVEKAVAENSWAGPPLSVKIIERNLNIGQPIKSKRASARWDGACNAIISMLYAMRGVRDAPSLEKSSLFRRNPPRRRHATTSKLDISETIAVCLLSHACLKKGNRRHFHARHAFVPSRMTPSPKHLSLRRQRRRRHKDSLFTRSLITGPSPD